MYCLKFWGGVFIIWWITLTSIHNYSKWGLERGREQKKNVEDYWSYSWGRLRTHQLKQWLKAWITFFWFVVSWYILLIGANCNSTKIILTLRHCPFSRISFTDFYVIKKKFWHKSLKWMNQICRQKQTKIEQENCLRYHLWKKILYWYLQVCWRTNFMVCI